MNTGYLCGCELWTVGHEVILEHVPALPLSPYFFHQSVIPTFPKIKKNFFLMYSEEIAISSLKCHTNNSCTLICHGVWVCTSEGVCTCIPGKPSCTCTIAASKIKGTAREIYRIFPCNGDFPCMYTGVYTGKIPASKATKTESHDLTHCGLPSRKKKKTEGVG